MDEEHLETLSFKDEQEMPKLGHHARDVNLQEIESHSNNNSNNKTDICNSATVKVGAKLQCPNGTAEIDTFDCTPIKIIEKSGESCSSNRPPKSAICEKVKVIVRCRPISPKEIQEKCESIVTVNLAAKSVEIQNPKSSRKVTTVVGTEIKTFSFDAVYDTRATQRELYDESFRPLVNSVLEGFNGTIFAYGQTGTGKTYTMEGKRGDELQEGVIPNSFRHIFQHLSDHSTENKQYLIRASYLEIYQEEIRDLLFDKEKNSLELRESPTSGVYVKGLTTRLCGSFDEIEDLMSRGNKNRSVGATNMNEHSSRSHAIFTITVDMSETWPDSKTLFKVGKLNLVDLAGSERQGKTGATGERLKEASKINLSLSALGNVIAALVDDKSTHIPYRDSKLTRLLQDSLGGNSKTVMVATVGPACSNREETITTLRYANRAKNIKNKPKVNEDPKDALLREYQEEILNLRDELERRKSKKVFSGASTTCELNPQSKGMGDSKDIQQKSDEFADFKSAVGDDRVSQLATLVEPYGIDPTLPLHVIMEKLAEIRKELVEDNLQVKNEKDKLLKQMDNTTSFLKHTQKECSQLVARISWLESKVFTGGKGKDLVLHTEEQAKYIEATQIELTQHIQRYAEMEKKFQEEKFSIEQLKSQSAEAELEFYNKSKKYDKVCRRIQSIKDKVKAKQAKQLIDVDGLRKIHSELKKEFTLKKMIIDNFVPRAPRKEIEKRMVWDDDGQCYKVTPSPQLSIEEMNPPIDRSTPIPMYNISETGVMHKLDNVHFTNENLLQLHPEVPKRKTRDYIAPTTDPRVTSLMNKAIHDIEKNLVIDCSPNAQKFGIKRSTVAEQQEYITIGETVLRRVTPAPNYTSKSGLGDQSKSTQFLDFAVISSHRSSKVDQRLLTQYILDSLTPDS